jgi:integrase
MWGKMAMASESKRATKRLTAAFCENVKEAGRYEDGNGLGLVVSANGARRWLQRIVVQGKRRDLGLGSFDLVPLAEARAKAVANRKLARAGGDPLAEKREKAATPTFAEATGLFLAGKEAGFRNPKHRQQWRNTLHTYAFPKIGHLRVSEITVQDVLRVLAPIWTEKNETASRVRGRIEAILAWATTQGHRMGDNPARWKGGLETILPQPGKVQQVTHHSALSQDDAPRWWIALQSREGMAAKALAFLTLTWARSGEIRGAEWHEIDLERGIWTIPASRMKAGREHRVALSGAALDMLRSLPRFEGNPLVFPAARGGMLSDMTLSAVMRRMQETEGQRLDEADKAAGRRPTGAPRGWIDPRSKRPAVPHGWRSVARDWAAEQGYDRDLAEIALAHIVGSDVERAYRRGDMLDRRRAMAEAWARFLTGGKAASVVPFPMKEAAGG